MSLICIEYVNVCNCMLFIFMVNGVGGALYQGMSPNIKKSEFTKNLIESHHHHQHVLSMFGVARALGLESVQLFDNIYINIVCSHCRCNEFPMSWINVCAYKVKTMFQYPFIGCSFVHRWNISICMRVCDAHIYMRPNKELQRCFENTFNSHCRNTWS